jgi:hypothetical protein
VRAWEGVWYGTGDSVAGQGFDEESQEEEGRCTGRALRRKLLLVWWQAHQHGRLPPRVRPVADLARRGVVNAGDELGPERLYSGCWRCHLRLHRRVRSRRRRCEGNHFGVREGRCVAGGVPGLVRLQLGAAEPTLPTRRERTELRTPVRSDWPGALPHGREFAAEKVAATVSACRRGGRRFATMAKIESKHDVRRKVREAQAQANRERLKTESDNREDMVAFLVAQQKLTAVDEWESDRHEQAGWKQTSAARNSASRVLARWRGCVIAGSPWPALRRSAGAARKSCAATSKNCAPRCRDRLPTAGTVRKH